ncbi:hypothetical protein CC2G_014480 [Coprinopsis cinerea AmutBmut pab1-1]|nr:hypothetical protein CC2G_014480 [Coprinopsis cinerea AmutBmut pab1-1]
MLSARVPTKSVRDSELRSTDMWAIHHEPAIFNNLTTKSTLQASIPERGLLVLPTFSNRRNDNLLSLRLTGEPLSLRYSCAQRSYYDECLATFPASIECADQRDALTLPVEPIRKPGGTTSGRITIPAPVYMAGFLVSDEWVVERAFRPKEGIGCDEICEESVRRWHALGSPKPYMPPMIHPWPSGGFIIHFATYSSGTSHRESLEYFYEHRDAVLDRTLELMDFTEEEEDCEDEVVQVASAVGYCGEGGGACS